MRLTEFEQDAICDVLNGKHISDIPMERLYRVVERIVDSHQVSGHRPRVARTHGIDMRDVMTGVAVVDNYLTTNPPRETS